MVLYPIANGSDLCGDALVTRCVIVEGKNFVLLEPQLRGPRELLYDCAKRRNLGTLVLK